MRARKHLRVRHGSRHDGTGRPHYSRVTRLRWQAQGRGLRATTQMSAVAGRPTGCSRASPSSTGARPPCGSSTPCATSTRRRAAAGTGSRRSRCTPRARSGRCSSARPTSRTTSGPAANRPYLDYAVLERALTETGADAAWVGWGFVAEDPGFAELCARIGVTFIGPSPEAMRQLGDKIGSKLIAEEVGVPVAPWSGGGVDTLEDAKAAAARIGYPLMLKATAGGGGRGIRMVASDADLTDAYERTRDEAQRAFGSGVVFLERLVTGARHVEVQVIADGQGTAWAIGVPRLLHPAPQPEGHRGVRLTRPRSRRRWPRSRPRPSASPSPWGMPAPARSSSSTTRARSSSPSSR